MKYPEAFLAQVLLLKCQIKANRHPKNKKKILIIYINPLPVIDNNKNKSIANHKQ